MLSRFRPLIAWLSIALLAMDLVVGAAGHTHERHDDACHSPEQQGRACCHHHTAPACDHDASTGEQPRRDQTPHDDCSLCRHFSQAAAIASIAIELSGSELVEPLVSGEEIHRAIAPLKVHAARGPPSLRA